MRTARPTEAARRMAQAKHMTAPIPNPSRRPPKPRFFFLNEDDDGGDDDDGCDPFVGRRTGATGTADSNWRWNSSAASITIPVDGLLT